MNKTQTNGSHEDSKLRELFLNELKDIYWAEQALCDALPKMEKKASSEKLRSAISSHLEETKQQVRKVEKVFELIGEKASTKKCKAMDGLIKEADDIMGESDKGPMMDAGIISAAQKVEHYEIASYGTLRVFARTLGLKDAASVLEEILEEERSADEKLTDIAEASINEKAVHQGEYAEEEAEEEEE